MASAALTEAELEALPDRIGGMYAGRVVLVTGGTGFLGKVLVEKLLRRCPDIEKIVLLVRTKRGKDPRQRLEDMFSSPLFEKVKAMRGGTDSLIQKLDIVAGDCSAPDLALSQSDRQRIIEETDFIIHAAATIRFDEELKKAVLLNTRGTKLMLQLAKECKKMQLFVHVSTSYCHLHEKLLEERPYPPPADPHAIISCMEWMDDDTVAKITPNMLDKLPNSYAFTKALSEGLVVEAMEHIPAVILRPSIVIPIWQEPIPGWTDNINGPTGLLIGAGKGVIRTMYCNSNGYADFLPVDVFVNGLMVTMWNYIVNKDTEKTVYNFTSSAEVKVSWSEMIETGREIIMNRVPLNGVAWYPGGSMKHSRFQHNICVFLFHLLPAMFVDTLLFCLGYKPVLMRVQRRINKGFEVFEYYANNQWDFQSNHVQDCRNRMNKRERRDYKIDSDGLDISKYFEDCIRAARIYILKESEESLPAARRHMLVMWIVDRVFRAVFWGAVLYWLSGYVFSLYGRLSSGDAPSTSAGTLPVRDL